MASFITHYDPRTPKFQAFRRTLPVRLCGWHGGLRVCRPIAPFPCMSGTLLFPLPPASPVGITDRGADGGSSMTVESEALAFSRTTWAAISYSFSSLVRALSSPQEARITEAGATAFTVLRTRRANTRHPCPQALRCPTPPHLIALASRKTSVLLAGTSAAVAVLTMPQRFVRRPYSTLASCCQKLLQRRSQRGSTRDQCGTPYSRLPSSTVPRPLVLLTMLGPSVDRMHAMRMSHT